MGLTLGIVPAVTLLARRVSASAAHKARGPEEIYLEREDERPLSGCPSRPGSGPSCGGRELS